MIGGERVSVTTGSLNRLEFLKRSLTTWIAAPEPDEIVVVDWGNKVSLRESLKNFEDPRIVHLRVAGQQYWHNAKCHNLEFRFASGDVLLRLDNDHLLGREFFARHHLDGGCFCAGNWKAVPPEVDDKRNLSGVLYVYRRLLYTVNGYNERLAYYGKEDDDLYDRLAKSGLKRIDVDLSTLDHIPHSDRKRYENLQIAPQLPTLLREKYAEKKCAGVSWADKLSCNIEKTYLIAASDRILTTSPWTSGDRMARWQLVQVGNRSFECEELLPGTAQRPGWRVIECNQ